MSTNHPQAPDLPPGLSRRLVLLGSGALASAAAVGPARGAEVRAQTTCDSASGLRPFAAALHVHACFSEGRGSMQAHLDQAQELGVDVLWWTEHDWRMRALEYRERVGFEGRVEEEDDKTWQWSLWSMGAVREAISDFTVGGSSEHTTQGVGSLRLGVRAGEGLTTEHRLNSNVQRKLSCTSVYGQTIEFDVYPERVSDTEMLAFEVITSHRPVTQGRPSGSYRLSYRIGGPGRPGAAEVRSRVGVITVDAPAGEWTRVSIRPAEDITALWPEIDGRDAASVSFSVLARSEGVGAPLGYFDDLSITRDHVAGDQPLQTQAELMQHYEEQFPQIRQEQGLEVSRRHPHLLWLGGDVSVPVEVGDELGPAEDTEEVYRLVDQIHAASGVAGYAHPFADGESEPAAPGRQRVEQVAARLVDTEAYGCDLLEVGYRDRGGGSLRDHETVWDAVSRAGIYMTGIGTNDDHDGVNWAGIDNNFITWLWASGANTSALQEALNSGFAYFGDPVKFSGRLNVETKGGVRMGQVALTRSASTALILTAEGMPVGSTVEVIRLEMDAAGSVPRPEDYFVRAIAAAEFADGPCGIGIGTVDDCLIRTRVVDASGETIALSNPLWLLGGEVAVEVPAARQVSC